MTAWCLNVCILTSLVTHTPHIYMHTHTHTLHAHTLHTHIHTYTHTLQVSLLKKTRHENVALFMGASLIPPNLAIVTSFCRGHILYKHLHIWSELFPLEKCLSIANQVAHGLGYLHARNIVHKDLNTKNIFLDKDKVVITDLGISSLGDTMRLS